MLFKESESSGKIGIGNTHLIQTCTMSKNRYQVWSRLEENGQINMKVTPSQIEFTLPSPKIGIENLPVVDSPWMPKLKTKVENLDIRRRGQVDTTH